MEPYAPRMLQRCWRASCVELRLGERVHALIENVFVIGAGSWGTSIANLLAMQGLNVSLWAREREVVDRIARDRQNTKYLAGIKLSNRLRASATFEDGLREAQMVVYAIPTQSLRAIARATCPYVAEGAVLINLAKGIEEVTGARGSEILAEEIRKRNPIGALSGPNIALEVALGTPSTAVVACNNYRYLDALKRAFSTPYFQVYENPDLAGTELGGALKNVFAIMAGIGDGLGYGANTKAAIVTRGVHEMVALGVIMGGHRETFHGLSGVGDLMATCVSEHSRNRRVGELIGRGYTVAQATDALRGRVAEGLGTINALYQLKRQFGVKMPIVDTLYHIVYEGLMPRDGYLRIWKPNSEKEAA
jgi:glycerol-3-phosphate dehydrogenase (NAD(P)+)